MKSKNIISNKISPGIKKFTNRPQARYGRVKSQEEKREKKHIPLDTNYLYNQNIMLNSIIEKNLIMKKTTKELNKNKLENFNSFSFNDKQNVKNKKKNFFSIKAKNNKIHENKQLIFPSDNFSKLKLKTMSGKQKDMNIEQSIIPILSNTKFKKNFFDDIKIKNIITLWNDLEVQSSYRKYFFFIYKEIDENEQENLYQNEINELIELKNNLRNLTYNIELRIGIVKKLSELNKELNKEVKYNQEQKVNNFIINEMLKEIEKLTEQTVNIVLYMKKVKTVINAVSNLGKYNIDIISKKLGFDKNYIIKMKDETFFLLEGYTKIYFNIKDDESPFFMNLFDKNKNSKNEPFKYDLTLSENIINNIKECNYYIYKELIAYQNEKANKKVYRCISPLKKNNSAYNYANINFYNDQFITNDEKKETDNKNEKEELIVNGSCFEINKDKIEDKKLEIKRNPKNHINNSVKLVNSPKNLYSNDSNPNNRNNKKTFTYNDINLKNNNIKKNKNGDILNNLERNSKINLELNNNSKSEINLEDNKNNEIFEESKKGNNPPSFSQNTVSKKGESQQFEEDQKDE